MNPVPLSTPKEEITTSQKNDKKGVIKAYMPQNKPLYIAFEGGEGSGKSTQAMLLTSRIGSSAILTREPGGTLAGAKLREILLSPETGELDPMSEVYLMAADRAQHMAEVVKPSLKARRHVISDRTFVSSIAYQGAGRGLGEQHILDINLMNPNLIMPDLMFLLTPPPPEELARRMDRELDRFEQAGRDFHARVAEAFGQMANTLANYSRTSGIQVVTIHPETVGQTKDVNEVHTEIVEELDIFCEQKRYTSPV